jgi:hypothetical protein
MNLLNFSHPLTPAQYEAVQSILGGPFATITEAKAQFDPEQAFTPQAVALLDSLNVDSGRWQGEGWVVVLPSLNYIAAVLLAELHGRMGHFPTMIRLRPAQQNLVTVYEVAEIINLEQVRQTARTRR